MAALTAASVDRVKPDPARRQELPDALLPGLYLVVQPSGVKSWAVRYRHGGKPRKMTLGAYPALDLATARGRGREALQVVALGRDPGAEKIETRRKAQDRDPGEDLVPWAIESFLTRHARPNTSARSAEEAERTFKNHVLPHWKTKRLDEIKRRDVVQLLDRIVDRGHPAAANRALAVVRKFFAWSVQRSMLDVSPCLGVAMPAENASRDRVLSDDELRLAWSAAEKVGPPFGAFVQLLILTAQRRDEVAKMTRSELRPAERLWTIPAGRAKNGIANDVPLSPAALDVLATVPEIDRCAFTFTGNGRTPIAGYSDRKERLDVTMLAIARAEAVERSDDPDRVAIPSWRLHDLRRTAASGMARLGTPVHVIEAVLNHTSGQISGVAAVYNRHRYLDEKRAALEAWAAHVARVAGNRS